MVEKFVTSIIKSLIAKSRAKSRKLPTAEEAETLQRSNLVLQFRVQQICLSAEKPENRAAA